MEFNLDLDNLTPEEFMKSLVDQAIVKIFVGMMPEEFRDHGEAMFAVFSKHGVSPDTAVKILMDLVPVIKNM